VDPQSPLTHGPAGTVQVYENTPIIDSTLHTPGLPSNVVRVIEHCCSVCKYAPLLQIGVLLSFLKLCAPEHKHTC
jgi:hypothetical protein